MRRMSSGLWAALKAMSTALAVSGPAAARAGGLSAYDQLVLSYKPVAYWRRPIRRRPRSPGTGCAGAAGVGLLALSPATSCTSLSKILMSCRDVRGCLYWSLLDTYERGSYEPTFGLVAWDRETFARRPKPSPAWLGEVARTGVVPARPD
ncbi:hypothetical protein ABZW11_33095 [Nonomuraea sp. NPDC004580]|uniref:hypothetical protein n=1 Tax=Nonomuraea sp. NPDC004580 TaxID=3154552 RepID=UPI0033A6467A